MLPANYILRSINREAAMRITGEIFQVGGAGFTHSDDAAVYMICIGEKCALVDAGTGIARQTLSMNIKKNAPLGFKLTCLFLTHCHFDHTGGATALKEEYGLKIAAHDADAVFLESGNPVVTAASWYGRSLKAFTVDIKFKDDTRIFDLNGRSVTAIHTPGHSPGSTVFVMESEGNKVLFGHDIHGPLHPDLLSDRTLYENSLKKLLKLNADILCEGHFGVIRGKDEVARFIRSYL